MSGAALAAWKRHTARRFTLRMFEGDHFYLHDARRALLQFICGQLGPWLSGPASPVPRKDSTRDG